MADPVKLAFVGCGNIARQHLKGYELLRAAGCRDYEYVACCDVNEANANERADQLEALQGFRPAVFTSHEDLLKAGVAEAADCCLPHWLHHIIAIPLLEGGMHVLVEKPIGITVKATKAIMAASEKAGKIAAVAEQIRRFDTCRAFRWAIAERKYVGDIRTVKTFQVMNNQLSNEDYKFKWRLVNLLTGGGMIMDSGAHYADMMMHIFGDVDEVFCSMETYEDRMVENAPVVGTVKADVEEAWHAIIRFQSGMEALWTYSRVFHGPNTQFANYYGSEGTISAKGPAFHPFQGGGTILMADGTTLENEDVIRDYMASLSDEEKNRQFPYGVTNGFGVQVWDFCDAIRSGRKPEMDAADGLRSKTLCETCFESATAKKPVKYADVYSGAVCEFQKPIDEYWGL